MLLQGFKLNLLHIWNYLYHSCMPSPLAPEPIRSGFSHVFVVYSEPMAVWRYGGNIYLSIYLIIQSELWILKSVNGNIYFFWNYSDILNFCFLLLNPNDSGFSAFFPLFQLNNLQKFFNIYYSLWKKTFKTTNLLSTRRRSNFCDITGTDLWPRSFSKFDL